MNQHRDDWVGETIETPGMMRWSNNSDYFIKRRPGSKRFQIGLESKIADGTYIFHTSIEFDDEEAPDLMDRIAIFNDIPPYSDLLEIRDALAHVLNRLDSPIYSSGVFKGAIMRELRMALDGEKVEDV